MALVLEDRALEIVLVEDDLVDVMSVRRALAKAHVTNQVLVASNGVEALQLLRSLARQRYVVLLDLNMPIMGGIEFLQELRRDPALARTKVIVLTTSSDDRRRIEGLLLGVAGYLQKPVTFPAFAEAMAKLNVAWTLTEPGE